MHEVVYGQRECSEACPAPPRPHGPHQTLGAGKHEPDDGKVLGVGPDRLAHVHQRLLGRHGGRGLMRGDRGREEAEEGAQAWNRVNKIVLRH